MTTPENPFEALMKMGEGWTKELGPVMEAFEKMVPTMPKEAMEAFMGKGASPDGLDAKTRLLLTLQGLIFQGALLESQIRLTFRHLKEADASDQEITEAIALAGLFAGAPAMTKALQLFTAMQGEKT